jgi:hypothetical protein
MAAGGGGSMSHPRRPSHRHRGVLLRSNAHIAWLVIQLQLKQIPASEEGGNPLDPNSARP